MTIFGNKTISPVRLIWTLLLFVTLAAPASAQELLSGKKAEKAASEISGSYKDWTTAGWSAKVRSDLLPVSVTAKTFMQRDSLTLISLRAPLIGEVARIEIDRNAIIVANKMKKRYMRLDIAGYGDLAATLHSNIQDILIGRVTLIGVGTLSKSNAKDADIYKVDDNTYLVGMMLSLGESTVNYGYAADRQGRILEMMATQGKPRVAEAAEDGTDLMSISKSLTVGVAYDKNKADAELSLSLGQRLYSASLEGAEIEWGTKGFDRLNLRNYTLTASLKELLRF